MVNCKNISVVFERGDLMCAALGRRRSKGAEPTKALGGWDGEGIAEERGGRELLPAAHPSRAICP